MFTPTCKPNHTPPSRVMPTKTVSLRKKVHVQVIFLKNRVFLHEQTIFTVTKPKTTA